MLPARHDYASLLPPHWKETLLPSWFAEDFSGLDVASAVVGDAPATANLFLKSETCCLAGRPFFDAVFQHLACRVRWERDEGELLATAPGERTLVARVDGPAAGILRGERIALNVLARCSACATQARHAVDRVPRSVRIAGTRKTTPGLRLVEKYALVVGGADSHRYDATATVMLKDNHIDALRGDVAAAVRTARQLASLATKIEVECRGMEEAQLAIHAGADIIMLDNFRPSAADLQTLRQQSPAVAIELSGGVTLDNIAEYAALQPDIISLGALTHSPPPIDFSLKIQRQ